MVQTRLPFPISKDETFYEALNGWIGDVLYDILPEQGFELRDEQIFMAFQLDRAFKEKKVMFAEAGVGTGKTIVYLLYAISYARYTGKPAVIACADEALIEQLVKKEGDIKKLEETLNLTIDVRLAKSNPQFLCLQKLDNALGKRNGQFDQIYNELPDFVHENKGMQSFYPFGDRKQYPHLTNEEWNDINWDPFQDCFSCSKRHRCGLTLTREHYRKASDLIICSHDFYMEHIWTYEARKREGQLPLLPDHSVVVFDEGHLLEFAAQKALTYRVKRGTLQQFLERLLANDIREEFALLVEDALALQDKFFDELDDHSNVVKGSNRRTIKRSKRLLDVTKALHQHILQLGDALVFESELYTIEQYELSIVEEYLDQMEYSLRLFLHDHQAIDWLEGDVDLTLVIMPRTVKEILANQVFSKKIPYIFSSATLSDQDGSFQFLANSLGVDDYVSFSVASPFNYEEQMEITIETIGDRDKSNYVRNFVKAKGGKTLILFRSEEEMDTFKQSIDDELPFSLYFEGDREISELISLFQEEESSVLAAVHLWEGLDIPGPSLSNVIIWSLPFPPNDPVFEAKRKSVQDPHLDVDMPYMILRLKQGIGRLIRSKDDRGSIAILMNKETDQSILNEVQKVLPVEATVGTVSKE
ncbi:ATP-dependent DNA helicase [Bacillus sp. FJAT-47783]|uniref:ATP-dependent DNA helicase n=1 Tax=Bacillus sp. FJAT-47783 TaxID=2922712 RepID=UPI001FAB8B5E|nr:ATP-dependent DNA helicase [Bacillus sp. FJAT-47783]